MHSIIVCEHYTVLAIDSQGILVRRCRLRNQNLDAGCIPFGVKHLYARVHFTRSLAVPGLNGVRGGPRCGPLGIPWRRARLASGGRVAACPAAGCSLPWSFICRVPISPQIRSGMPNAGVDGGSGEAAECRHAADERARVDLACVRGLAAGCKRGLDAAASGTAF